MEGIDYGLRILGNREYGHSQRLPEIFWLPPIISRTGKATDFKFGR